MGSDTSLYFNPRCSKCRTADALLKERGVEATTVRYLENPPSLDDLHQLMAMLGISDPRLMMRTGETVYKELGLAQVTDEQLLVAITENPILLERPIFIRNGRAVLARPAEKVLDLLED